MDDTDIQMKEYEALRQEILEHQRRRGQFFIFTITALGVIGGFMLKVDGFSFVITSFVPYLIIFNFCDTHYATCTHVIHIGTYIRIFIESNHPKALHWETGRDKFSKKNFDKKSKEYWYVFCYAASIVTCLGTICLICFTNKLGTPLLTFEVSNTSNVLLFGKHINLAPLEIWICPGLIMVLHIIVCCGCIMKGVKKIHWGTLNQRARKEYEEFWTDYYRLL